MTIVLLVSSSPMTWCLISHWNEHELSHTKAIVWMADVRWALTIIDVCSFPVWKRKWFSWVQHMSYNVWSMKFHIFPMLWYVDIAKKGSITEESIDASWSKCVASNHPNHLSISCIQPEHNFCFYVAFR